MQIIVAKYESSIVTTQVQCIYQERLVKQFSTEGILTKQLNTHFLQFAAGTNA